MIGSSLAVAPVCRVGHRTCHNIKVIMDAMTHSSLFAGSQDGVQWEVVLVVVDGFDDRSLTLDR